MLSSPGCCQNYKCHSWTFILLYCLCFLLCNQLTMFSLFRRIPQMTACSSTRANPSETYLCSCIFIEHVTFQLSFYKIHWLLSNVIWMTHASRRYHFSSNSIILISFRTSMFHIRCFLLVLCFHEMLYILSNLTIWRYWLMMVLLLL